MAGSHAAMNQEEMLSDTAASRSRDLHSRYLGSYLGSLVEGVNVLNIFHDCELIVDVQLVDVFNHFSRLISDSTGSLTFRRTTIRLTPRAFCGTGITIYQSKEVFDRSRTFERAERTEVRVLMTFFLERTELALLSDCVLLWSDSELISTTFSGGGGLEVAFLSSLGAGLAGGIAAFCCKQTVPQLEIDGTKCFRFQITLAGRTVRQGNAIAPCTLIAAAFACAFFTS